MRDACCYQMGDYSTREAVIILRSYQIMQNSNATRNGIVIIAPAIVHNPQLEIHFLSLYVSRELPWLQHIVLRRTILNLTWRRNGACTKPDTSSLRKRYLSGNWRRKSRYGFTSCLNILSFRIICLARSETSPTVYIQGRTLALFWHLNY